MTASIIGFHNPKKHSGLTAERFLLKYVRRMVSRGYNTPIPERREEFTTKALIVLSEWDKWIETVKRLFPKTLI